jgi:predicted ArsR family transcriptional regulator
VEDLASTLDVHPNTVRHHLGALEDDGLVARDRRPTGRKGRPRAVYRITSLGQRSGPRNYELLARVLIERLASGGEGPAPLAREAGRSWAAAHAGDRVPQRNKAASSLLFDFLAQEGFEPVHGPRGDVDELVLHNCPFGELADSHGDLVCSVHEGLLEGLAHRESGPTTPGVHVNLMPFDTPTTCLVHVSSPRSHP